MYRLLSIVKLIFKHKFIGLKNIQTMRCCNLLNMSELNTGGGKIRLADFMNFNISAFSMRVGKAFFVG